MPEAPSSAGGSRAPENDAKGPRLSTRALLLAAGSATQGIGQIVLAFCLVRLLDRETFGTYREIWLVLQALIPFFLLGVPNGLYFFVSAVEKTSLRALLVRGYLILAVSGLLFGSLTFFLAPVLAGFFDNPEAVAPLRASAPYALLVLLPLALFHFQIAVGRHARAVAQNLVFYALHSAAILAGAFLGWPLPVLFAAASSVALLRMLQVVIETQKIAPGSWTTETGIPATRFLSYALPIGLSGLAMALGQRIDKLVVASALPASEFAPYSVGAAEFPGILLISQASYTVMLPRVSELYHASDRDGILRLWKRSCRKLALFVFPIAAFLFAFAPEFIRLLYTPEYAAAVAPFRIYLLLAFFRALPTEMLLTATGRSRTVLAGVVGFLTLSALLTVILLPPLGFLGPPVGIVAATGLLTVFFAGVGARRLRVPFWDALPLGALLPGLAVAAASALASAFIPLPNAGLLGRLVLGFLIFVSLYALSATLLGVWRREDWRLLGEWITLKGLRGRPSGPNPPA